MLITNKRMERQINYEMKHTSYYMFINYLSGVFNGGNEGKASSIQLPQLGSMSMPKEILQQYTTSQTALMININKVGTIESPISERVFKTAYENNMYYGEMIFIDERECGYNLSQRKPLTGSSFSKFIKCSPYADSEVDSEIITVENQTDYNQLGENVDFFNKNGVFRYDYEIDKIIKNTCRFSGRNSCHIENYPRLTIDKDFRMKPCFEKNSSLTIKKNSVNMIQCIKEHHKGRQVKRECLQCGSLSFCSRCSAIPLAQDDIYCGFMKKKTVCRQLYENIVSA